MIPQSAHLSTDEMIVAAQTFQDAYLHVLSNHTAESKTNILQFVAGLVLKEKPYMLVGHEGLVRAVELTFSNEAHRDFLFMLTSTFFSRFSEGSNPVEGLANTLAVGLTISSGGSGNLIPEELRKRMPLFADVQQVLKDNTWLMTIVMIQLFIAATLVQGKA